MNDNLELTDAERLSLEHVARFNEKLQELRDCERDLHEVIGKVHAAIADLGRTIAQAKEAVRQLAREEVRRYLAKESERIAQRVREDMKRDR